jgi:citrate lyase subunit beta/citryl-CoA lyase
MPGANARALEKARGLACDAIIMDLEDAVTPDAKVRAREQILVALAEGGYGEREVVVRANALSTPWGRDDLVALAKAGADAILLPKIESADALRQALSLLDEAGAPETLTVWVMMEMPRAILEAQAIASASPKLTALVMGTSDLAEDLHAAHTTMRLPLLTALSHCILAARAYDLVILDGVYLDLADDKGFAEACHQGAELGFDGKTLIHPKTITAANAAFAPSETEVEWARRIIAAHAEAEVAGKGVVLVDGKLIENLHVAAAHRTMALTQRIEALEAAL